MCHAQRPQRSDACEAPTLVSSQALNHWATALPPGKNEMKQLQKHNMMIDHFIL